MTFDLDDLAVPSQLRPFAQVHLQSDDPLKRLAEMLAYDDLTKGLDEKEVATFALRLREADPADRMIWALTDRILPGGIPTWHWRMVNDLPRNESFQTAINANVQPGMTVLDIGTGTGLLAMMSARAGAHHVYAVEVNPLMAEIARRCVEANGFSEQITIIEMQSDKIEVGKDIPAKCDLLTHEILSTTVLAEGVIPSVVDARERLLAPGAPLLPERTWGECVVGKEIGARKNRVSNVNGFDLSPLNILSPTAISEYAENDDILSERFRLPELDLRSVDAELRGHEDAEVALTKNGTVAGLIQWLGYSFPDGSEFVSDNKHTSWGSYFHAFGRETQGSAGDRLKIRVDYQPNLLSYALV